MATRARPARRREPTPEEYQTELLQRIADDLHGFTVFVYWVFGVQVVVALMVVVVALS